MKVCRQSIHDNTIGNKLRKQGRRKRRSSVANSTSSHLQHQTDEKRQSLLSWSIKSAPQRVNFDVV